MVGQYWPFVAPFLRKATEKTRLSSFADIESEVIEGNGLLWVAWNERIEAAATTVLNKVGDDLYCTLTACGGTGVNDWIGLLLGIEKYARIEGCKALRIFGRKGWAKLLKDYEVTNIVLEKAL